MAQKKTLLKELSLRGLEIAPSQVRGAVRIVPLLRRNVRGDLRLMRRAYNEDIALVASSNSAYISYIPHGLVLSWSDDGSPIAAFGGQVVSDGKRLSLEPISVRILHRMAKRESRNQLRFLPMHLAMEGFLSMFFNAPAIAWSEYSKRALSRGLDPRWEMSYGGRAIAGLEDALRVFEIHENQVGVLLFVADALASAFVVPTPEDYRALHSTLLEDFYGELICQYALLYDTPFPMDVSVEASKINSLTALRQAIARVRSEWGAFHGFSAQNLLERSLDARVAYSVGAFTLQRFVTGLRLKEENHIGEAIVRETGEIEYLKTYRLSAAQTRRVYLLSQLANYNWNLDATAVALGLTRDELVLRFENAGFGYLLNDMVRQAARKKAR